MLEILNYKLLINNVVFEKKNKKKMANYINLRFFYISFRFECNWASSLIICRHTPIGTIFLICFFNLYMTMILFSRTRTMVLI